MGLAEVKRKQRLAADPQNKHWKDDTNKFGYRMLKKMGWEEGGGLGRDLQGLSTNPSIGSHKRDTLGLGEQPSSTEGSNYVQLSNFDEILGRLCKDMVTNNGNTTGNQIKADPDQKKFKVKKKKKKKKKLAVVKESHPGSTGLPPKLVNSRLIHRNKFIASKRVDQYTPEQLREILGIIPNS